MTSYLLNRVESPLSVQQPKYISVEITLSVT